MSGTTAKLLELFLVFGAVLGFGFWQLWELRKANRAAKLREDARHAERQQALDEGVREPPQ